jgi:hypothetical protein
MKGKLIAAVGILCIACLVVSGANAKGKPVKPDDKTETELIVFSEDLNGFQVVEDCCPNAGPFPEYTMWLDFAVGDFPAGTYYDGYLFINNYGAGRDREYKVQFWNDDIAIEIIGGVIDSNKKTKELTVTFTDELCVDLGTKEPIAEVSFVLVRTPY